MAPSALDIDYKETTILNDSKIDLVNNNHGFESDVTGFASKSLIQKVLKEQVARINTDTCEPGEEDAFYVADLGEVYRQHLRWKMNLSRVKPFYGEFYTIPFVLVTEANGLQRSNAIRTKKYCVFWQNWALGLIVLPGPKLTWSSTWVCVQAASSMLNHARPSLICATRERLV